MSLDVLAAMGREHLKSVCGHASCGAVCNLHGGDSNNDGDDDAQIDPEVMTAIQQFLEEMQSEILAMMKKGGFTKQKFTGRRDQGRAATPPRSRADLRCVNCGKKGHDKTQCRAPKKDMKERPCFKCNQVGHLQKDCPMNGKDARVVEPQAQRDDRSFFMGMVGMDDDGYQTVRGRRRPELKGTTMGELIDKAFKAKEEFDNKKVQYKMELANAFKELDEHVQDPIGSGTGSVPPADEPAARSELLQDATRQTGLAKPSEAPWEPIDACEWQSLTASSCTTRRSPSSGTGSSSLSGGTTHETGASSDAAPPRLHPSPFTQHHTSIESREATGQIL